MRTALDVGCGEGQLAEALSVRGLSVTGIDVNNDVLDLARHRKCDVTWVRGNVLSHDFCGERFDLVTSVAVMHHLPQFGEALMQLRNLIAPGGTLVILGLARNSTPVDLAYDAVGAIQHRFYSKLRGFEEDSAPQRFDMAMTYRQTRRQSEVVLPGRSFKRLPLFRYLILWRDS